MTAIYGNADRTVCGVAADGTFRTTSAGDGHVTHEAARASTLPGWYAFVPHVDLPADPGVTAAVLNLLAGRTPGLLFTAPPAAEQTPEPLSDPRGELLVPTAEELVRMAWGSGGPGSLAAEQRPTLRVSVVHGDLRAARAPVLVGTYDGTPLDGAQKVLDRHLGGALSRRVALGQYPGPVGTCAVFGAGAESSAVVLGLGDSGDITPGRLATSVTQACCGWRPPCWTRASRPMASVPYGSSVS